MKWDNSPVYRRRRRIVFGGAVLALVGITSCGVAVTNLVTHDENRPEVQQGPTVWERSGKAPEITLAFAGDVQAHNSAGRINDVGLGETGKILAKADLAMLNLETVVAEDRTGLKPQPKPFTFATGPKILDSLKKEGVDVVTAANNHTMDFGDEGMKRMLAVKATSPVPMVGLGKDDAEAWAPWTTEVKGRKVVVFGATDVLDEHLDWKAGPNKPGLAKVKDDEGFTKLLDGVKKARAASPDDVVVVYLHSGTELVKCPTPRQQQTMKDLAAAGADVVIGSHAHILQPTATQGNTAIAYGMGNFVFGSGGPQTRPTGVLTVTIPAGQGAGRMTFNPARVTNGLPQLLTGAERDAALKSWEGLGKGC
ncbi:MULTISPECIES: CapA family protein [unclassified Luteococcus]|uniref:CapA family protein n=1 Tax=unclassified Luteococcus TaxID=2639923 RepID=UPI00313D7A4D